MYECLHIRSLALRISCEGVSRGLGTRPLSKCKMRKAMSKKNTTKERFDKVVALRLTTTMRNRFDDLRKQSNCRSLGEFLRSVLQKEEIIWYHRDATFDEFTLELAAIRKELRAIGVNINQATHFLNGAQLPAQKLYHAKQIVAEYHKVNVPVERVLRAISNAHKKWSPRS
jgi:hypothetical protein